MAEGDREEQHKVQCNTSIFVKKRGKKSQMRSKTISAEVWTLFLPPTWPEVGYQLCKSTHIPLQNSAFNSHPAHQAWQVNPSCNSKSQTPPLPGAIRNLVSFSFMTTSPFPGQGMLSPQQTQEFCKILFATNMRPAKNSKEQIQDDFAISEPEPETSWPLQINNKWKNYKYRSALSNTRFTFLLIPTL